MAKEQTISRRAFVQCGMLGSLAAGAAPAAEAAPQKSSQAEDPKRILNYNSGMKYRRMGNLDLYVSEISLGGLVMVEPVYHHAIERGVNLLDISRSYRGGMAIRQLGNVLKTKRDKVYVALKHHYWGDVDEDLRDLKTDYVDFLMFNHHDRGAVGGRDDAQTFEKYKKAGKARYAGLMTHGDVKAVTAIGVRSGLYTVVAPSLNQPGLEALGEELRGAHQKGVGVMAMKTMRGLGLGLQAPYLKQILRNPAISSVLKSIGSYEVFDAYQKAIHEPLTAQEARVLYAHAEANRANNCMMCDECKRACPRGVEVSTVLRCHDYYYGQMGDLETAVSTYSAIPSQKLGSAECRLCAKCEIACPNGIQIVKRLDAARDLFTQLA